MPPLNTSAQITALWPSEQAVNLGNLITFRKEIELLAQAKQLSRALLYVDKLPPFSQEILGSSVLKIDSSPSSPTQNSVDWPPAHLDFSEWCYGSFKRVSFLSQQTSLPPYLSWSSSVLEKGAALYRLLSRENSRKVIALHLKQQAGGAEESNASLSAWESFFQENPSLSFLLLGNDPFPSHFLKMSHLFHAETLQIDLKTQLAFCSICDGFLGMASGISTAACLSSTPYILFKHPLHHHLEMKKELGEGDQLSFAHSRQKIWRCVDSLENLRKGLGHLNL